LGGWVGWHGTARRDEELECGFGFSLFFLWISFYRSRLVGFTTGHIDL
jgi:hypothetical protein